jgi:hypothetical protein
LIRGGVDSPMETRVGLLIVTAGLPEPTVNVIVRGEGGSWRMRFDLCYVEQRLIVEYDGRQHADSPHQWERDIYRREELDRMDYRLLIVTSRGVFNEPHRTLERVRDALRERGVRVPTRFKNEWAAPLPIGGIDQRAGRSSVGTGSRNARESTVSSSVIANDPDSRQPEPIWTLVITNDPSEGRQRRQICTSGVLPPLTGGSLCCQIRRQLDAGGSATSAEPRCVLHQVAASSANSLLTASKILGANWLGVSFGNGMIGGPYRTLTRGRPGNGQWLPRGIAAYVPRIPTGITGT